MPDISTDLPEVMTVQSVVPGLPQMLFCVCQTHIPSQETLHPEISKHTYLPPGPPGVGLATNTCDVVGQGAFCRRRACLPC